jgi:hypothetical protein
MAGLIPGLILRRLIVRSDCIPGTVSCGAPRPPLRPYPYCDESSFATGNRGRSMTDSVAVSASPFLRGCKSGSGEPERRRTAEHPDRALVRLTGQVIEIGAGTPIWSDAAAVGGRWRDLGRSIIYYMCT